MADQFKRFGFVLFGDQGQFGVSFDHRRKIDQFPIDARRQRGLGKAGANGKRHLGSRYRLVEWQNAAVGQTDADIAFLICFLFHRTLALFS